MIGILVSTMLFAHVSPHVSPHVTPHVTTVHENTHTTSVHRTAPEVKSVHSSDVHMSKSGYNTNTMWHNWMLFHVFSNNDNSYRLDVKDKHGKLHTVHLTKEQYQKAIRSKHLLWVNGAVTADGKKVG